MNEAMNLSERIRVCATCQNCKRDIKRGIVCSLTDDKPTFNYNCPNYIEDEVAAKNQLEKDEQRRCDESYSEVLPGSAWFRALGFYSIINIVIFSLGIQFIISLGSTQILQGCSEFNIIPSVIAFSIMALIPVFMFWTWYLTTRYQSVYAYTLGIIVYFCDILLLIYLLFVSSDMSLIISLVFNGGVLIHLLINRFSSGFNDVSEIAFSKIHKILYSIVAMISIGALFYVVYTFHSIIPNENDSVEELVDKFDKTMPYDYGNGVMFVDVYVEDKDVYFVYSVPDSDINNFNQPSNDEKINLLRESAREIKDDILLNKIKNNGYNMVWKFCCDDECVEISFSHALIREAI